MSLNWSRAKDFASSRAFQRICRCTGLVAVLASPFPAFAQTGVPRSVADVRERIPDELDRPRYPERWTHRGWQLRTNVFEVVANTSIEDARLATAQAEKAWGEMSKLADQWTQIHRHPDFALGKVQIYVDAEPPKDRDKPATTLDVVGMQTQIHLFVSPDQPPLAEQLPRLREATAFALMHTAELDRQLPPWVCNGLETYAAEQAGENFPNLAPRAPSPDAPLGGQQWRGKRAGQDTLAVPATVASDSAERVKFLLAGNDASHAIEFFRAAQQSVASANRDFAQEKGIAARRGESQPNVVSGPLDDLAGATEREYAAWQQDPLIGQPMFEPGNEEKPELVALEREMVFALKLLRRFPEGNVVAHQSRMKVTTFDREKGVAVVASTVQSASKIRPTKPASMEELYTRITNRSREPWATIDPAGRLLLSTETARLRELLGIEERRYQTERKNEQLVLSVKLDRAHVLQGWLEENREKPLCPLAKFAIIDLAAKPAPAAPENPTTARR